MVSFSCGFAALLAELFTIKKRVLSHDYGGIEDTIDAVLMICVGIAVITILLNWMALAATYHRDKDGVQ